MRKFLENKKFILVNSSTKSLNGPFTRYEPNAPNDEKRKSALDLVIISRNLEMYLKEMKIDKYLKHTPFRYKSKNNELVYTNHYAILLTFKDIQVSKLNKVRNGIRQVMWNTNRKDGWKKYFRETNENKALDKIISSEDFHPNDMMTKIEKEVTKIKYKVFGKVSGKRKKCASTKVNALQAKKNRMDKAHTGSDLQKKRTELDKEIKQAVNEVQSKAFETEITKLKTIKAKKGVSAAVFNLRGDILGSSKSSSDPISINDPTTGLPILSPMEIKKVTLDYCVKLLTNRKPKDEYIEVMRQKELLHDIRMQEIISNDFMELTPEMFNSTLRYLARKNGQNINLS